MEKTACTVPVTQIILDENIYPRSGVYPKRVSMFAENIRDGFKREHPQFLTIIEGSKGKAWLKFL